MKRSSWSVIGAFIATSALAVGGKTALAEVLPAAVDSPRVYVLNSPQLIGYPTRHRAPAKDWHGVLAGDAVYDRDNLKRNALPTSSRAWQANGMLDTYALVRQRRDSGARVHFSHDDDFKNYKQPPAYYD